VPVSRSNVGPLSNDRPGVAAGVILYVAGISLVVMALSHLRKSAAVGLPERSTKLQTHGLYHLTRNPVYLGAFVMCAGSSLFSIHPLNILLFAIAVGVHMRIVTKEEEFLERRFGQQWLDYKQRVPRYIGRLWRLASRRRNT
jgi:protein-S-isoprenylcysteine O-methyltransferase Ste14